MSLCKKSKKKLLLDKTKLMYSAAIYAQTKIGITNEILMSIREHIHNVLEIIHLVIPIKVCNVT